MKTVIEMAREAGWKNMGQDDFVLFSKLCRFAALVREDEREKQQEPAAWLFQHEETGATECVDVQQVEWGFEKNNPRWQKIAPLYTTPPTAAQAAKQMRDAAVKVCRNRTPTDADGYCPVAEAIAALPIPGEEK